MKLKPEMHEKVHELVERFVSFREYTAMESSLSIESVFDALESVTHNYALSNYFDGKYSVTVTVPRTPYPTQFYKRIKEVGETRMEALVNVLYAVVKYEDDNEKY